MSAHRMAEVMDDSEDSDAELTLVIEEDPTRIELMVVALRRMPQLTVSVVDVPEGRMALSLLQKLFQGSVPDVVIVRSSPAGWTTAALLAALRTPRLFGRIDVVLLAEGTLAMLPVMITDFPGLHLLSPRDDILAILTDLRMQRDHRR